ncbi:MAG: glycyl-radical enzyme activating protein [Pseudomonadota bacterium]
MNTTQSMEPRVLVFDIQRFCLHDGPGIRTTVFFKGCPLSCIWCQNPESRRTGVEIAFYARHCRVCFACREQCPEGAILPLPNRRIDRDRCTRCGACVDACDFKALRRVGNWWRAGDLCRELLKDRAYFQDSGGGVTFSGGEPTLHLGFIQTLAGLLRTEGVHMTLETCGFFKQGDLDTVLGSADLIYFDIKHMDPEKHRLYTGADNRIILDNFREMSKRSRSIQARMPVIPGLNDDPAAIRSTARFLVANGHDTIHCLPYHDLGSAKRGPVDAGDEGFRARSLAGSDLEPVKDVFQKEGIHAIVYD